MRFVGLFCTTEGRVRYLVWIITLFALLVYLFLLWNDSVKESWALGAVPAHEGVERDEI